MVLGLFFRDFKTRGYEDGGLRKYLKITICGRAGKKIFWNIFCSGCDSMDVGRSGEVQGVVGKVWVVETICFFDGFSILPKENVEKIENTVFFGRKSLSCDRILMIVGAGSMEIPQIRYV